MNRRLSLAIPFVYALGNYLAFRWSTLTVPLTFGFIILLPIGVGMLGMWITPSHLRGLNSNLFTIILAPLGFVAILALILQWELLICIAMAAPFWIVLSVFGASIMRAFLEWRADKNQPMLLALIILAPFALGILETRITDSPDSYHTVKREILIQAEPATIWAEMTSVPLIQDWDGGLYGLFNLPQPRQATLEGEGIGAIRYAEYTNGMTLQEPITVWQENETLAFEVSVDATSPEPFNQEGGENFDVEEVRFWLESTENGTLLHLESRYRLSTPFNPYGAWWMNAVLGDLQSNLLEIIQDRAES